MRVLAVALLAAALAPPCQRWNPDLCEEDGLCGPGLVCLPDGNGERRRCQPPEGQQCSSSLDCPDELPLCAPETGRCRACAPGEDRLCRERNAARPRCLGSRCVECRPGAAPLQSPDCRADAPVCDPHGAACRKCRLHRECASGVCQKQADEGDGACVPVERVLVVDQSACNDVGPVFCTPAVAISHLDGTHRHLLFRRAGSRMEDLFSELDLGLRPEQRAVDLHLVGPLADGPPDAPVDPPPVTIGGVRPRRGFVVWPRTRVTLEGFFIAGTHTAVECIGDVAVPTELRIVRSLIGDSRVALSIKNACHLSLSESWLGRRPRRERFPGVDGNRQALEVLGGDIDLVNSVIVGNGAADSFGGVRIAGLGVRPLSTIVNVTFYGQSGRADWMGRSYTDVFCDWATDRLALLNTLLLHDPAYPVPNDGHLSPTCGAHYFAAGSDDPTLTANQSVVVPRPGDAGFRDAAALDLRLLGDGDGAPQRALRTAGMARVTVHGVDVRVPQGDLDQNARGLAPSLGAYERQAGR